MSSFEDPTLERLWGLYAVRGAQIPPLWVRSSLSGGLRTSCDARRDAATAGTALRARAEPRQAVLSRDRRPAPHDRGRRPRAGPRDILDAATAADARGGTAEEAGLRARPVKRRAGPCVASPSIRATHRPISARLDPARGSARVVSHPHNAALHPRLPPFKPRTTSACARPTGTCSLRARGRLQPR